MLELVIVFILAFALGWFCRWLWVEVLWWGL